MPDPMRGRVISVRPFEIPVIRALAAEQGHIGRAAKRLGLTQGSVGKISYEFRKKLRVAIMNARNNA